MSTGLELADFEHPGSIWKSVPKGYRSALRRSRDTDKICKDADDKNGVVVDALPLKKRRFRSPSRSPHSTTQSHENEETESEFDRSQRRVSADIETIIKLSGKIPENNYSKFDYCNDFSGIEILAAAACRDDIIDDICNDEEDVTREGVDSSASAVLFEENAASMKDLASEDKKETSSSQRILQPSRLHWDLNTLMDAWEQPCDTCQDDSHTDVVDNDLTDINGKTQMVESCGTPENKCKETSIGNVHDAKSSSQNVTEEACVTRSTSVAASEENRDKQLSDSALRPCGEISSSDLQLENIPRAANVKLEPSDEGLAYREEWNKANCQTTCSISSDAEESCRASGGDGDKQQHAQDMHKVVGCPSVVHASLDTEHANQAGCAPNSDYTSASAVSALDGQSMVTLDEKEPTNQVSSVETRSDLEHIKVEGLMEKACVESVANPREASKVHNFDPSSCLSKVHNFDPSDDSYESGVYQDDKIRDFGRTNSAELQAGHDSQIEDGELRESDAQCHWDENDDENREDELVDYGSESDEERHCSLDKVKDQRIETCGTADAAKDESDNPKTRTSDVTTHKDFLSEGVASRTSNKELLSCVEEGSNLMYRKDTVMRSRYGCGITHSRDGMGSDKDTHSRARSPGGWDSERRYSNSYIGGYVNGPRRMKTMEDHGYAPYDRDIRARGFARFDNHARGQFVNRSSNRRFEHSNGTRSSANGMNRLYVRDNSPTSNSFRRSPQAFDRGDKGGFCKPLMEDNAAYPNRLAHRLGMPKRERSISPVGRGGRGFARFDNHVRVEFVNRSFNSRFEHPSGTRSNRLYVRDTSPTSTSFRRSPQTFDRGDRGGFYRPVPEDSAAYPNRLAHRMGMPRRERSISPVGRGARGFSRFDNHVRGQYVNRSSNSRFEHSNGTRSSANGMNRLYVRESSPTSNSFRRSPQAFDRGERGGFYKPAPEGMPRRERSISPVGRGRSYYSESRSRGRPASYISAGEQIEGSRLRSRSPDFKSDGRMDKVKVPFQKRFAVGCEDDFASQKDSCIHPQRTSDDQCAPV